VKHKSGWWCDKEFKTIDIKKYVKKGRNTIELFGEYQKDLEPEAIYVLGDFGVWTNNQRSFTLGAEPKALKPGNWVRQGYVFYCEPMIYGKRIKIEKMKNEKVLLALEKMSAAVMRLKVNGKDAGLLMWQPFRWDITKLIRNGSNNLELEVIPTLRNLLGPHHIKNTVSEGWAGPGSFNSEHNWSDKYEFVGYGLDKVKIIKETKLI